MPELLDKTLAGCFQEDSGEWVKQYISQKKENS